MEILGNQYINETRQANLNEQLLMQDIVDEYILYTGQMVVYIPRDEVLELNNALQEPELLEFKTGTHRLPAVCPDMRAFQDSRNMWDNFGLHFSDKTVFNISKRHWALLGIPEREGKTEPIPGDIIYHELSRMMFQVSALSARFDYAQLSQTTVFSLEVVVYRNTLDTFETGGDFDAIFDVDKIATEQVEQADNADAIAAKSTIVEDAPYNVLNSF